TAVGYSSALMVLNCPNTHIDTIEIDPLRAQMAQQLWTTLCIDGNINSIVGDVDQILSEVVQGKTYDFVFLDGPKSRYLQHLQAIESNICSGGIVLADDVLFFGMVKGEDYVAHKHRTIVKNLRVFLQYLESNNSFSTQLLDKGNGIAIIKKK
ncbi:MAG: class I SAM-dependent methyltransferase, partial [Clostridia bacterium]